jgi:hypothetical protein
MSSLVFLCLSSHYQFVLLPHYEPVAPWAFIGCVQTIANDVTQAYPRLVPPLISHVCHHSGYDLFLCYYESIIACTSQLHLVVGHVAFY